MADQNIIAATTHTPEYIDYIYSNETYLRTLDPDPDPTPPHMRGPPHTRGKQRTARHSDLSDWAHQP